MHQPTQLRQQHCSCCAAEANFEAALHPADRRAGPLQCTACQLSSLVPKAGPAVVVNPCMTD